MKWAVVIIEEHLSSRCHHDHRPGWDSFDFHNALNLLLFVLTCEYWEANVQFVENASQTPHIDGRRVPDAHHDLWCSVEPTLDIGVELVNLVSSTSKVNYFDSTLVWLPQQNILRLHVTVDNVVLLHVVERHEELDCESSHQAHTHSLEVVRLNELVQVHAQHFKAEDQMLAENQFFFYANDVLLIVRIVVSKLF